MKGILPLNWKFGVAEYFEDASCFLSSSGVQYFSGHGQKHIYLGIICVKLLILLLAPLSLSRLKNPSRGKGRTLLLTCLKFIYLFIHPYIFHLSEVFLENDRACPQQ